MSCTAIQRRTPALSNSVLRQHPKSICADPIARNLPIWHSSRPNTSRRSTRALRTVSQASTEMKRMERARRLEEEQKRQSSKSKPEKNGKSRKIASLVAIYAFGYALWYKESSGKESKPSTHDPQKFVPFTIVSKESISSTSAIFTLRPSTPFPREWNRGVWSVEFKQPELQIGRAYTPLPPLFDRDLEEGGEQEGDLRFLIRKEYKGEVSSYLHGLPVGATIDVRGPNYEWEVPSDEEISDVIFLAGGTGIAPALQVAHSLFDASRNRSREQQPKMHIIWANRRREDCEGGVSTMGDDDKPLRSKGWLGGWWWADASYSSPPSGNLGAISLNMQYPSPQSENAPSENAITQSSPIQTQNVNAIISSLSSLPANISITYKVDSENTFIQPSDLEKLISAQNPSSFSDLGREGKKIIMVCGPDGFVEAFSGPRKVWWKGRQVENLEVGGVLGRVMDEKTRGVWEVLRLG